MSIRAPLRFEGGIASVGAGVLLPLGHALNYGSPSDFGTVSGTSLVLVAHAILVFALVGLYLPQREETGVVGRLGVLLSVLGTVLVSAVVFVELAGAGGTDVGAVLAAPAVAPFYVAGPLAFFVGLLALGGATARADVLPRIGGLLLVVGTLVFGAAGFGGSLEGVLTIVGAALTGAGFVRLGWAIVSDGRANPADRGRTAR